MPVLACYAQCICALYAACHNVRGAAKVMSIQCVQNQTRGSCCDLDKRLRERLGAVNHSRLLDVMILVSTLPHSFASFY